MADSALGPIQTAVYTLLSADATLMGLIGSRLYDAVPASGSAYPYVIVGDGFEVRSDTFQKRGREAFIDISVWDIDAGTSGTSSKAGYSQVHTIANRIALVLGDTESTMTVAGYSSVNEVTHEQTTANRIKEDAVMLRHILLEFKVWVS